MIYKQMCQAAQPIMAKIYTHPFNVELASGALPQEKFLFYLIQDSLYLAQFTRALVIISGRLQQELYRQQFIHFALGAIQSESALHQDYLSQYYLKNEDQDLQEPSPACFMYTNYLLQMVSLSSVEEAIASVLPCFVIYRNVGKQLLVHQRDNHPYHDWIALYSGEGFEETVLHAIGIVNEVASHASQNLQKNMIKAFVRSTQLEWQFWESAYQQERWLIRA